MKRKFAIGLFSILLLSLLADCCLSHDWQPATCQVPETCAKCGKTQGEPLGHDMQGVISGDTFVETCATCGAETSEPIEWESFAPSLLVC